MPWLLPSYRRPDLCKRAIAACTDMGMSTLAVLFVDPPHDGYNDIELPSNWRLYLSPEHVGMAASMRWLFEEYPASNFYGWLSDDLFPRTPNWDTNLIRVAGKYLMVCCNDLDLALKPEIRDGVICGAMCWGGELVRNVGWWSLPNVYQAGVDDAWIYLAHHLFDLKCYVPEVIVEHLSYRNEKRKKDFTDEWVRVGDHDYIAADFRKYYEWRASLEPYFLSLKLKNMIRDAGYDPDTDYMEKLLEGLQPNRAA